MFYGGKGDISGWGGDEVRDTGLDTELASERAKVRDLQTKWHRLSVKAMHVVDEYARHRIGCSSRGYDDARCDCGLKEAEAAFLAATAFAPTVDYAAQGGTVREVPGVPDVPIRTEQT